MAAEQFTNNAQAILAADISPSDSSLSVYAIDGLSTVPQYRIVIDGEIIIVGSVSGTTLGALTRGAEGTTATSHKAGATVTQVLTAGALKAGAPGLTPGSVYGFSLVYLDSTDILVRSGYARDTTDATTIHMSDDWVQLAADTGHYATVGKGGQIGGLDRVAIAGTGTTSNGSANLVGSVGTSFLTAFGTRTCSGTVNSTGFSVTGLGTRFLTEFAVGDMIGTAVKGYAQILSVDSDTGMTLVVAIPGGNLSSDTPICVEHIYLQLSTDGVFSVNSITDNTHLALDATVGTGHGSQTIYTGPLPNAQTYLMVWLGTGTSGTGVFLSTQRTTPFGIGGYSTNYRRIGSIIWNNASSRIIPFNQYSGGIDRSYVFQDGTNDNNEQLGSGLTATSWTPVSVASVSPPTASNVKLTAVPAPNFGGSAAFSVRPHGLGVSTNNRNQYTYNLVQVSSGSSAVDMPQTLECGQLGGAVDYSLSNVSGVNSFTLYLFGYQESL
jgi:hypothetical protein